MPKVVKPTLDNNPFQGWLPKSDLGEYVPVGMTADEYEKFLKALEKLDDTSALKKVDIEGGFKGKKHGVGGKSGLDALSTPSSKVLRQNLMDAGIEVPDYSNAAHHIVAGNSPKATEARAILQKYGIDINDAANGTFLPTVKDATNSAYHPSLHTNAYYDEINSLLGDVTSKQEALDVLKYISEFLQDGTFME